FHKIYMPIILIIGLLISPRLIAVLLAFLTTWFNNIGLPWVILGIIIAPVTLIWVSIVMNYFGGQWGVLQILVLVLALMADFGGPYYTRSHYHVIEHVEEV